MDALSDVLSLLRVRSVLSSRFEGSGAWAFRFPAFRHIKFGSVLSGQFHLWVSGGKPILLEQGDFYLLSSGETFCSASDLTRTPLDGLPIYRKIRGTDGVVRYRGDESDHPSVSLASGRFTFETDVTEMLLRHLPPIIHLPTRTSGSSALSNILDLLKMETDELLLGADFARSSLASLTLIHVLRTFIATQRQPRGWLAALEHPKIGNALTLMHDRPAEKWTLESLARAIGMSRTAFAATFRRLVGSPPLEYLYEWRMSMARTALRHTSEPLSELAMRLGYLSDTAFSIAFKRSTGKSPGRFRTGSSAANISTKAHSAS
jgi:AraC-like DNA-binding protein